MSITKENIPTIKFHYTDSKLEEIARAAHLLTELRDALDEKGVIHPQYGYLITADDCQKAASTLASVIDFDGYRCEIYEG